LRLGVNKHRTTEIIRIRAGSQGAARQKRRNR